MFGTPGVMETVVLGVIALLLFGKRLPEVARSLGQSFVEFKRGMTNIETDVRTAAYSEPSPTSSSSSSRVEEDLKPTNDEKTEEPQGDSFTDSHVDKNDD